MIDLSRIDFHSFNCSKNLVGSFYWRGFDDENTGKYIYYEELIHKASLLVYDYFKDCWNDFFILSGLRYCEEYEEEPKVEKSSFSPKLQKQYDEIFDKAKEKGWLIPFNDEYDRWHNYRWFNLAKTQIPLHFLRFCFDSDFTLQFSELSALKGGETKIIGETCFLINPKLQLALYTHWDIGYACIDLGDNPQTILDFLKYCDTSEDFVSHIEEEYL